MPIVAAGAPALSTKRAMVSNEMKMRPLVLCRELKMRVKFFFMALLLSVKFYIFES